MFKFNKSVDQELEQGELSDDGVNIDCTAPVSVQPKPKTQTNVDQESASQEYVFETIKITSTPERKKDRKELKIIQKNRQLPDKWNNKSVSPDSRNYQPKPVIPINPYYHYSYMPPTPYIPQYPPIDHRSNPYPVPPNYPSHSIAYQRNNYTGGQAQWLKNQYPGYQHPQYGVNGYNGMLSVPQHNIGNLPYHPSNAVIANQNSYNMGAKILSPVNMPKHYTYDHYNAGSNQVYNANQNNNTNHISSVNIKNESLQAKRASYDLQRQEKMEKKRKRAQNISKIKSNIDKVIDETCFHSLDNKQDNTSKPNKSPTKQDEQKLKNEILQIMYILKGVYQQRDSGGDCQNVGINTLCILDRMLSSSQKVKLTVYRFLQCIQAKQILDKLRQMQMERKIMGSESIEKYRKLIQNIQNTQSAQNKMHNSQNTQNTLKSQNTQNIKNTQRDPRIPS